MDFIKRMDVFWSRDDFETVVYELMGEPKPPREGPAAKAEGKAEAEGEADAEAESEPESSK